MLDSCYDVCRLGKPEPKIDPEMDPELRMKDTDERVESFELDVERSKEIRRGIDLATTLERIAKNFVITDPRLPDNPIVSGSDEILLWFSSSTVEFNQFYWFPNESDRRIANVDRSSLPMSFLSSRSTLERRFLVETAASYKGQTRTVRSWAKFERLLHLERISRCSSSTTPRVGSRSGICFTCRLCETKM